MASVVHTFPQWVSTVGRNNAHAPEVVLAPQDGRPAGTIVRLPRSQHMKLVYLRRRIAVALALVAIGWVLFASAGSLAETFSSSVASSSAMASQSGSSLTPGSVYSVKPGDTLWSIVAAAHPNEDPREIIAKARAGGMSMQLQAGQQIVVP